MEVYGVHLIDSEDRCTLYTMSRDESTPTRQPLTPERIVDEGIALADGGGLDALSMRTLAQRLGVVPMALYKHVANKDELLDGMVDRVWTEVEAPSPELGWRDAMRRRSVSLRAALLRHRWAVGMMEARLRPGHREPDAAQRDDGLPPPLGVLVPHDRARHVGARRLRVRLRAAGEDAAVRDARGVRATSPQQKLEATPPEFAAAFPYLLEVVAELGSAGYDYDAEFATGLDVILDGIERLRPGWATADADRP